MTSVLLYTPGIDSLLAYHELCKQNKTPNILAYYCLNSRYNGAELQRISQLNVPISLDTSLNLCDIEKSDAYIPNRNLLMAMHAAGKYNADYVYIGGTLSDRVSDNNEDIMNDLSKIISKSLNKPVIVTSPFWNKYKVELVRQYVLDNPTTFEKSLTSTFSCYSPLHDDGEYSECLHCSACFRKSVVLFAAGIKRKFKAPAITNKYYNEFSELQIHTPRSQATLDYIKWLRE